MSQEGANLPQEVEGSHDQATAPHGSIPAGDGSPTATVMPAGSNSSFVSKLASAVNNSGPFERASPAVLSVGEDNNVVSSKIASPVVLDAGDDNNAASKIAAGPAVILAGEENKAEFKIASPAVLVAGEEKDNDAAGSKLATQAMLHDCDNSKAGSLAGVHDNAARSNSELAIPAVLRAGDGNNGGSSKIASPAVPHAIVDNTTGSKLDSPAVVHAGEDKNTGFKLPNPAVLHASKDMDNNAGRPKFASPLLLAGEGNRARIKLAIQAASHAGGNAGSSRITRSAALRAGKDTNPGSMLSLQVVSHPHASKDSNAGSSKAARSVAVDAGKSNAMEGKNNVAREQRGHEADVRGHSGMDNAAALEGAELHIFTERERRKKMKNMFSTLHALLPQLPDKADKSTIVGEAVTYIKTLERTAERLEKLKLERKRAQEAQQQQQQQHAQQQQLVVGGSSSSSRAATAPQSAPALPAPPAAAAAASSSREATLADMVHGWEQQKAAATAALNKALVAAASAVGAGVGAGGSSSSSGATATATATALALPRGAVPFPAPTAGFQTWTGQNVVVSVANNEAYINLHCPRQQGTLTRALFVLERHHIDVVTTTVSAQDGFRMYGIHARANPASAPSARFPENLCAEDRFKLAVSEIVQLINI